MKRKYNVAKLILPIVFLAIVSCKKDNNPLFTRVLEVGTKCNIATGIFQWGDKQPAQPVTVISTYRAASSGLIFYNVSDAKGEIWQIPDNDLTPVKQ